MNMFQKVYTFEEFSKIRQCKIEKQQLNKMILKQLVVSTIASYIFIETYNPYPFNTNTIYGKVADIIKFATFGTSIVYCLILLNSNQSNIAEIKEGIIYDM